MKEGEVVIQDEEGNILSQLDPYLMDLGSQACMTLKSSRGLETESAAGHGSRLIGQGAKPVHTTGQKSELTCNGTARIH